MGKLMDDGLEESGVWFALLPLSLLDVTVVAV
jgi:hypothetical protein